MTDVVTNEHIEANAADQRPILEAKGISKAFGHVQALDDVDFELYPAEVVALVGDNGAGKSTLVKILSGIYRKDSGQIYFEGQPVELRGPKDAERLAGISTVYQDLALVGVRDVASNIFLNMEPTRLGIFIDFNKLYAEARRVIDVLRIDMPSVKVNVNELSGGQRQGVAISRALARGRRIFILDEPTAALGVEQQHKVNDLILTLKDEGKTVLVISHNLEHVFTVADRLVVLRRGKRVGTRFKSQTTREEIVGLITAAIKGDIVD
ncbi:MAG: sugar ABC transporter ATP-binding protein [Caldilineales bacterium]|nr:sugar ABC transporter ATP-binding protein [Caldilineales bacterium]